MSQQISDRYRTVATFLLLAIIIAALRFPFAWTGNEENYFLLAHRLIAPESYGPLHAAFDASRGKWLGLGLFGTFVEWFGFETAHRLLGFASIAVTAAGLAAVARFLGLGALAAATVLLVFMARYQNIAGGEWFIGGIETKAFAYGFGMLALASAAGKRIIAAALLTALSAYFHFLVGGFWLICVGLFIAVDTGHRRELGRYLAVALVLLVPLLAALLLDLMDGARLNRPAGSPSADYIYSILRAPHHVAPFAAERGWALGAVIAGVVGLIVAAGALLFARNAQRPLRSLLIVIAVLGFYVPVAVLTSWFDRGTGALGKFYLFRPTSPLLLLGLFAASALLARRFPRAWWLWAGFSLAAIASIVLTPRSLPWPPEDSRETAAAIAAVQAHTRLGELVLLDPVLDRLGGNDLPRKLGRDTVVSWKFVPTNPRDIYRWYSLIEWRRVLFEQGCPPTGTRIGALIVASENLHRLSACGRVVHRSGRAAVIDLR